MLTAVRQGRSLRQIAAKFGVSRCTVQRWVNWDMAAWQRSALGLEYHCLQPFAATVALCPHTPDVPQNPWNTASWRTFPLNRLLGNPIPPAEKGWLFRGENYPGSFRQGLSPSSPRTGRRVRLFMAGKTKTGHRWTRPTVFQGARLATTIINCGAFHD